MKKKKGGNRTITFLCCVLAVPTVAMMMGAYEGTPTPEQLKPALVTGALLGIAHLLLRPLLRVRLFTGRAHQIRVQHAHAGFPLWGDARYGGGKPGQQIALWAASLAVEHPTRHETLRFAAPPPRDGAWRIFGPEIRAWFEERNA